jgi:hypothetical protein
MSMIALHCPACGCRLAEPHVTRARIAAPGDDDEEVFETMSCMAWRCSGCRRLAWRWDPRDPFTLSADPVLGPIFDHLSGRFVGAR